ncbi:MAG: TonB-dependent receptor [Acidobacteriota bacterium]|nr:TonB-dependent receptor [Acidobacteriota bacterium]
MPQRKKIFFISGIISLLIFGISFDLWAQEKGKEDILFMKIPEVFASSKRLQPITETASSVEIITAEQIRQSGAISIADVLRNVSGVEVRETSVSSHAIGIRGFADAQHVLITLNGSSAYLHHVNHTYVDFIPVALEEIECIEIVKGPGGVFYGGSAFSGIINIVTKNVEGKKGTQVNMLGGNWDTMRGNLIHAGKYKNLGYSFSVGRRGSKYMSPPRDFFMNTHSYTNYGAGELIYHLDDKSSISAEIRHAYSNDAISRHCTDVKNTYVTLRYDKPNFWIRFFYNKQFKNALEKTISVDDINHEFEIMRIFKWGKNITSIGGFAKKVNFTCRNIEGDQYKTDVVDYAIKAENEYRAADQFILTLGGRVEYYSELDFVGLGRGSIIYKPAKNQRVRLTFSSGYYLPSLAQLYGWGKIFPDKFNPSLNEERITSYELAYYGHLTRRIKLNTSVFYNNYRGLIHNDLYVTPKNKVNAHQRGLELGLDFLLTKNITGFANYTYQSFNRSDFRGFEVDPHHMLNLGFQVKFVKWSSNLTFHHVDKYYEIYDAANPALGLLETPQKVDSYTTVDARISYRPTDNLDIALAASNLLQDIHYETNTIGWIGADRVCRQITARVSWNF